MGKKIAIISVIILISALAILGFFIQQGRKNLSSDPYKVISPAASIIIETIDLKSLLNSLTTGRGLFGEIGKIREVSHANQQLKYLADLLNKQSLKKLFIEGSTLISFQPDVDRKVRPFISMPIPAEIRLKNIRDILSTSGVTSIIGTGVGGHQMLSIPFDAANQKDTLYISKLSGLLVCSTSQRMITEAFGQQEKGTDIRKNPGFSKVLLASGKNIDKIFVNFPNLSGFVRPLLKNEKKELPGKIAKLAGTAGGDIYISEDGIVLSGYTECTDSLDLLFRYKQLQSLDFHTYKILPSSTVLFETFIFQHAQKPETKDTSVSVSATDLAGKISSYTGNEITRAIIDIKGSPVTENTLIIYQLTDRIAAEQLFIEQPGAKDEILFFQPDEQVKIPVYKTSFKGLCGALLPGFAPGFDGIYFSFYDNYLIEGNSEKAISRLLYANILNKTLANDLIYRDFQNTLPSRAAYYFFCVPSKITDYLEGFLNERIINALRTNRGSINKIQAAGYKFSPSNGMLYNSFSVKFKEETLPESTTEWETLLDTVAAIKPFFFTNHITGAKEIFTQDMKNNAYLINAAGRVLWKVPLNERIVSGVFMVDYYRNGKYQLMFSGKNYLHLLDRNGNYVERYPVKLRSPATNSMTLYDYDNNLNYRIFIAGEDKLIYSYDKTGNVVKGWTPFQTAGYVKADINYFKVSGKDFIVASDEISIYFLDRSGNKRISPEQSVSKSNGSNVRLDNSSDPSVVSTSSDGTIQNIFFDGKVKKSSLKNFSDRHTFDIFDIDGDGLSEYIFIDKGILYLYNHNKQEIFKRDFGSDNLGGPICFVFSASDRKIGVFDSDKNLIYLIDKNGNTMEGFPLRGASMFSIGKLSEKSGWHLIVGGTDKFLYNYKIETDSK